MELMADGLPEEPYKYPRPWAHKDAYKESVRYPLKEIPIRFAHYLTPIDYRKEIYELKSYMREGTFPNVTLQVADIWIRKCMQLEEELMTASVELMEAYKTIEALKNISGEKGI